MKVYQQYINGEFRDAVSKEQFEVINPFTEKVVSMAPKGGVEDAALALEAATSAQKAWAAKPCSERAVFLSKMAQVIRENREMLAATLAEEQAKILPLAQVEIDATTAYFDYYAGWANKYEGEVIQSDRPNENILLYRQPLGVVVGICPWNFPFFVMARKVAPSILTGCTIILKPSSDTPNTTFEFAKLIEGIGLPKGVLNFVAGGGSTLGDALVRSPEVGLVTLTGSVETGQRIISATAENITKTSLELGGKAPVIVCDDCNMDTAIKGVVDSRIIFSGQVCNCAERVYVESGVYDEFMDKLTKAMSAVTYGDPFADPAVNMSSQINQSQVEKIEGMVETAKKEGAEVLVGGSRPTDVPSGYFFQPTLLANCSQGMEIIRKEIFGPVLPVVKVDSFDQALDFANDCEYGLTSSIFTTSMSKTMRAINELQFGETYVNREHFESIQGFHAGWRKSGIGGADGKHGLYEYLQTHVAYIDY